MIRWLLENVGLMLLAGVIAVVVWIAQEWERDRIVEADFDQPIPVTVQNQPPDTYLVDNWQKSVSVHLRAPQSVWDRLGPDNFTATLDLSPNMSPLAPGIIDIEVQVSLDAEPATFLGADVEPVTLLGVEPEFIRVELEAIDEGTVPVSVEAQDEPDLGYQAGDPVYTDTVKVKGPASRVARVVQAVSNVSLEGARATVEELVTLMPVDAEGKRVNGVTLEPDQVPVSVSVRSLPNVKEMSVTFTQLGQPAEGYHITNIGIEPPVVRVRGPVFILQNLPGFLTTVPISIAGQTEDIVERLPLDLPPGISMFDPAEPAVQVTIEIEPFFDSVTVTRTLTFQGLRAGLAPAASPEAVEVILSGPRPRLANLLPEDVRVVLDLSDMRFGDEAQLEPVVVPPEGVTVDSIIPSVIQVRIEQAAAPTSPPEP